MVRREVTEKVLELLKNQEKMDTVKDCNDVSEVYSSLSKDLDGITEEEFAAALKEIKEGEELLDDTDLENVSGGIKDASAKVVVAIWW